ncbi:transposase [Alteromonas sp. ASW11-130]|uniref:transposase n=1 Tax=Alteromonas sp. ASW11-130 TaxID=3015775 RepID=UPI003FA41B63
MDIADDTDEFTYKDFRQPTKQKAKRLIWIEFICRYLCNILPKGFMRVRHFGYLAYRCRRKN